MIWEVKEISDKMLAVPKDSSSCWKTDYMHAEFGNKDGVKHWQYGIVKKVRANNKWP